MEESNKQLNTIGDLIGEDGNIMLMEEIKIIIQGKCNLLLYIRIKKKYKTFWRSKIYLSGAI